MSEMYNRSELLGLYRFHLLLPSQFDLHLHVYDYNIIICVYMPNQNKCIIKLIIIRLNLLNINILDSKYSLPHITMVIPSVSFSSSFLFLVRSIASIIRFMIKNDYNNPWMTLT